TLLTPRTSITFPTSGPPLPVFKLQLLGAGVDPLEVRLGVQNRARQHQGKVRSPLATSPCLQLAEVVQLLQADTPLPIEDVTQAAREKQLHVDVFPQLLGVFRRLAQPQIEGSPPLVRDRVGELAAVATAALRLDQVVALEALEGGVDLADVHLPGSTQELLEPVLDLVSVERALREQPENPEPERHIRYAY